MNKNNRCFFVSDLHGYARRYDALFSELEKNPPRALFMGGDLLPSGMRGLSSRMTAEHHDFIHDYLAVEFSRLKRHLKKDYPRVFLIMGNDDGRFDESSILDVASAGIWQYVHNRHIAWNGYDLFGYAFIPPTPFRLKDWERYDVSRYVDPGCISPEDGALSVPRSESESRYSTIQEDLKELVTIEDCSRAICLFHSPPYKSRLDRAALDGQMIDYVPLDVHIGSIAIRRFIEKRQPRLTLHGHVHESARLTKAWSDRIGSTVCLSAAHDGPELALVSFDPEHPQDARRELIPAS